MIRYILDYVGLIKRHVFGQIGNLGRFRDDLILYNIHDLKCILK